MAGCGSHSSKPTRQETMQVLFKALVLLSQDSTFLLVSFWLKDPGQACVLARCCSWRCSIMGWHLDHWDV